jgi:hypothetical protein
MASRRSARDSVVDVGLDPSGRYTVEAGRLSGFLDKVKENPVATLLTLAAVAGLSIVIYDELLPMLRPDRRAPTKRSRFDYARVAR